MKNTPTLFEVPDTIAARPSRSVAHPIVEASEDSITGVAGIALWGELLDHLGLVDEADRRNLRPIGPGGYTGGECYRSVVEVQLAGGDFLSDRSLLADEATQVLRGDHALPSHTTLFRFLAGSDLGRAQRAAAINRAMLRRAWTMGAAPTPGILTIDPDATWIRTYGKATEGSVFSYQHEVGMSPMVGVCGETGDVLALRARAGNAQARRGLASFIDECVSAIPAAIRADYQLWFRSDSAGYQADVVEAAARHSAAFTATAPQNTRVLGMIHALAADPDTEWRPATGAENEKGSEVTEWPFVFAGRQLRLIVRRQPKAAGEQLSFDDLDGWRFQAIITNIPPIFGDAVDIEAHHRLRGGGPEEAIRQLKGDFGLCHAPVTNFFGNWVWWHASALAYNVARWIRVLALPEAFRTCRGKRLRLAFFNVAAKVVSHGRQLYLRLGRAYAHADSFIAALGKLRALPFFT